MTNLDMRNMQDHYPSRGDQVEAWIKDRRDSAVNALALGTLDDLLEEYRLAADTGQSLENIVNGEEERPERGILKKKRLDKPEDYYEETGDL